MPAHDAPPPYNAHGDPYNLDPLPQEQNRPALPENKRNIHLAALPAEARIVKFQTIVREGREIVVGRIKVPTPATAAGARHAFILRRYDTNAISLTTMYKVAFPTATDEDEKREMDWVKSSFDTRGTNGGRDNSAVRLAGQWVSRSLAIHLAPAYKMDTLINALARAVPDPNVAYRKSQRSQAASDEIARQSGGGEDGIFNSPAPALAPAPAPASVPSLSAGDNASPAAKRRRRDQGTAPQQASSSASAHQPSATAEPSTTTTEAEDVQHISVEATTTITAPAGEAVDMNAEIEQAKQLVKDLRDEIRLRNEAGNSLEDQGVDIAEDVRGTKRGKGQDEGVALSGGASGDNRVVRTNKRIPQNAVAEVGRKFGWGALVFSVGLGASLTFISQYASNLL
ncbi:hypothetical protein L202_00537 [Cryptococcus amylolentus CBS 6039]|uniref:HTH APSES-type domain-containing protein n=2 Tax=Cryptococcus amylolentus TaxID=104669 RepID=A0A1E3I7N4_9TREE|nr:hypothetical protein L202_00537 [Cryptococcus amylolentus CBS 6039]ODN84630.1 hypothetical protein L202_00537 [Cryptococcus amylolentus CBS 6039]ODO11610.1 hypothetical protein I350_00392 [Cryptococcus amylolentus CBS 6273]